MNAPPTKERDRLGGKSEAAQNQILNQPTLSDYSISGNSRLVIGGQPGSEIREEFVVSSRFVLRTANQRWCFDTLWEAVCQQQRLSTDLAAKEGEHHDS
jgi:hypothetical protein